MTWHGESKRHSDVQHKSKLDDTLREPMEKEENIDYDHEAYEIYSEIYDKYPDAEINLETLPNNPQILFIDSILIPEDMRGEGIGTKIIKEIIDKAKAHKFEAISLQAFPKAESDIESDAGIMGHKIIKLIHFYEKFGFQLDDEVEGDTTILEKIKADKRYAYSELSPPFKHSPLSMGMDITRPRKKEQK